MSVLTFKFKLDNADEIHLTWDEAKHLYGMLNEVFNTTEDNSPAKTTTNKKDLVRDTLYVRKRVQSLFGYLTVKELYILVTPTDGYRALARKRGAGIKTLASLYRALDRYEDNDDDQWLRHYVFNRFNDYEADNMFKSLKQDRGV